MVAHTSTQALPIVASQLVAGWEAVGQLLAQIAQQINVTSHQVTYLGVANQDAPVLIPGQRPASAPLFLVTAVGTRRTEVER